MPLAAFVFTLLQVTPPPPPPVLATPTASPQASPAPSPSGAPATQLQAQLAAVNLHPGGVQSIAVSKAAGVLRATIDTPVATVSVDPATNAVTVTAAQTPGFGTLILADQSGSSVRVPVRVAFDAGTVPAALTLRVTGTPVDPAWLQAAIRKAVISAVQVQPGATVQVGAVMVPMLAANSTASLSIGVHIAGGDRYFDVDSTAGVNVQQVTVAPFSPAWLFYDDDPEKLSAEGLSYRNTVAAGAPARLYYYHQNAETPRRLLVVLRTQSSSAASVHLIDSSAGPNQDVMTVGHAVSRQSLLSRQANLGTVVDVAPGVPYVADDFALGPLDGAAGSVGINVLSGGPIEVSVLSAPAADAAPDIAALLRQPQLPGDGHHRTGVFRLDGYGQDTIAYTAGGQDASVLYGATTPPPADAAASGHDYGDYGVIRTLNFDADNPTGAPVALYLYEQPQGGVVRSSFLVNGTLVQLGCARVANRYRIGQPFVLAPGQRTTVAVQTMTDGGSNYPLEVGLTATPPEQSTPPISAPDGCFPKPAGSL